MAFVSPIWKNGRPEPLTPDLSLFYVFLNFFVRSRSPRKSITCIYNRKINYFFNLRPFETRSIFKSSTYYSRFSIMAQFISNIVLTYSTKFLKPYFLAPANRSLKWVLHKVNYSNLYVLYRTDRLPLTHRSYISKFIRLIRKKILSSVILSFFIFEPSWSELNQFQKNNF